MITRIFMDDLLGTGFRMVDVTREYTRGTPRFRLSLFDNLPTGIQVYTRQLDLRHELPCSGTITA